MVLLVGTSATAATLRCLAPRCCAPPASPLPPSHDVCAGRPTIEWYPGHIAKAERLMSDVLQMVDVVVELRDARIPRATAHPLMEGWVGSRGFVRVLNRMDSVPARALNEWSAAIGAEESAADRLPPLAADAQRGGGVPALKRAIVEQGQHVNARRRRRGLNPRPVRAAILGYPNVGKSALINRLVGRRKTKSENRPGVTRGFSWIGIDKDVQLLDSPGIIPAKQVRRSTAQFLAQFLAQFAAQFSDAPFLSLQVSQLSAYHLAMCDDIGFAAYDVQGVAAALYERLIVVAADRRRAYVRLEPLEERWGVPATSGSGEEYLDALADARFTGDVQRASTALLKDFRSGRLGPACIEMPDDADGTS